MIIINTSINISIDGMLLINKYQIYCKCTDCIVVSRVSIVFSFSSENNNNLFLNSHVDIQ